MSIELNCIYCKGRINGACKTQPQAETCAQFRQFRNRMSREKVVPVMETVTIEEIDKAIVTLQKVKEGLTK